MEGRDNVMSCASAFRLGFVVLHGLLGGGGKIIGEQRDEPLAVLGERGAVFLAGDEVAREVMVGGGGRADGGDNGRVHLAPAGREGDGLAGCAEADFL